MASAAAIQIRIEGLVQGVGFRPFVYRLARQNDIAGWVANFTDCVEIRAEGAPEDLERFTSQLRSSGPPAARISKYDISPRTPANAGAFTIRSSGARDQTITDISPDLATCEVCLRELRTQPRRRGYPLINCTECGPRFTIIQKLPYDRPNTTMAQFSMCALCKQEYADPADRRFHAQPTACNSCGPAYTLHCANGTRDDAHDIFARAAQLLDNGAIVAVKGVGGFHLACDAWNRETVQKLRKRKKRDQKPFALMFADMRALESCADLVCQERTLLRSPARPIVLVRPKQRFFFEIHGDLSRIGAMLPYAPVHTLLFEHLSTRALVMTSGNLSEEPVIIDNEQAHARLGTIADAILDHNRVIHNRADDSVAAVYGHTPVIIRRSRGYVPNPVPLSVDADGILAVGGELKNCFAVGKANKAILSQHIGDLKNAETFAFFTESVERLQALLQAEPLLVAHDLHPDYLSTRFALRSEKPTIAVQHHHAHIAAVMAEFGIDEPVIGVAFDGAGYGDDGSIWGGEILTADLREYRRAAHARQFRLPGGDQATRHPWRSAVAALRDLCDIHADRGRFPFLEDIPVPDLEAVHLSLDRSVNALPTSSMGRLFDAVSALLGLCPHAAFEAHAAMRLEAACRDPHAAPYPVTAENGVIQTETVLREILADFDARVDRTVIASRFHASVAEMAYAGVRAASSDSGIAKVVLSGGCFQNACILSMTMQRLKSAGFTVYVPSAAPCNDGGIALGQLVIAAKRRSIQCA